MLNRRLAESEGFRLDMKSVFEIKEFRLEKL